MDILVQEYQLEYYEHQEFRACPSSRRELSREHLTRHYVIIPIDGDHYLENKASSDTRRTTFSAFSFAIE
jgi:hypothetical protein